MEGSVSGLGAIWIVVLFVLAFLIVFVKSLRRIGAAERGLVVKRWSVKKLKGDNLVAFNGEAGYQEVLLPPGLRLSWWPFNHVIKCPVVQVQAGEIGVVIAQVGKPLDIGAKSAIYKEEFGDFTGIDGFINGGGQKGVQRPVLRPGTTAPIHPIGFLVLTPSQVYGVPIDPELRAKHRAGTLSCADFGLNPAQLMVTVIAPKPATGDDELVDTIGIVTTFEGDPLPKGAIASRLGGFDDIAAMESDELKTRPEINDQEIIEVLTGSKNVEHNSYQDYQKFLDGDGRMGLQHDPLKYGAFNLNPFLVSVELVPMLVVKQGEVAVIKAYVGLATEDTSGEDFKHGALVRPGRRGIWREPLRTGKYPINPRCYKAVIVRTAILTLNWAEAVSKAHDLDRHLNQISAKSQEGFVFRLDLQVQIHVPDTQAPKVISRVGSMENLVNEVVQAVIGNHFRNTLQGMGAVTFIQSRKDVQVAAGTYITEKLAEYNIETQGVYIQDVALPEEIVDVLTKREVAVQEKETYQRQEEAELTRISMEHTKATADKQEELAFSEVEIKIQTNTADARIETARGEAEYVTLTGKAEGEKIRAEGVGYAEGYKEQVAALGAGPTAAINIARELAGGEFKLPEVVVMSGGNTGAADGLMSTGMQYLRKITAELGGTEVEHLQPEDLDDDTSEE